MSEEHRPSKKTQLAVAMAQGNPSPSGRERTRCPGARPIRWAKDPEVRAAVEAYRRRSLDRAVGRMSRRAAWAADGITELAQDAESESVKLAALRSILSDMMAVAEFAGLEERMAKIEEQLHVRDGNAGRRGLGPPGIGSRPR